ncbi:MAG: carbon storage regulator [Planctomycetota bacterium]
MLVLSRKQNQTIEIPEYGIEITLVSVGGNRAKIGIQAPREIAILRSECLDRDRDANPEGATTGTPYETTNVKKHERQTRVVRESGVSYDLAGSLGS